MSDCSQTREHSEVSHRHRQVEAFHIGIVYAEPYLLRYDNSEIYNKCIHVFVYQALRDDWLACRIVNETLALSY